MKSLSQIKAIYAQEKHFKTWEHFCLVANDAMFIRAVDEIAQLFAESQVQNILIPVKKMHSNPGISKRNKTFRAPYSVGF
jgi:hypothetical protein